MHNDNSLHLWMSQGCFLNIRQILLIEKEESNLGELHQSTYMCRLPTMLFFFFFLFSGMLWGLSKENSMALSKVTYTSEENRTNIHEKLENSRMRMYVLLTLSLIGILRRGRSMYLERIEGTFLGRDWS